VAGRCDSVSLLDVRVGRVGEVRRLEVGRVGQVGHKANVPGPAEPFHGNWRRKA
jgi:hypothetical protein